MNQVDMIYKMNFQYNQQLYKKHYKCKYLEEKKEKNFVSFAAWAPPLCS